jgi:hypothetical protein
VQKSFGAASVCQQLFAADTTERRHQTENKIVEKSKLMQHRQ